MSINLVQINIYIVIVVVCHRIDGETVVQVHVFTMVRFQEVKKNAIKTKKQVTKRWYYYQH